MVIRATGTAITTIRTAMAITHTDITERIPTMAIIGLTMGTGTAGTAITATTVIITMATKLT